MSDTEWNALSRDQQGALIDELLRELDVVGEVIHRRAHPGDEIGRPSSLPSSVDEKFEGILRLLTEAEKDLGRAPRK